MKIEDYVIVRGGLVQNFPSVPVWDVDFLDADFVEASDVARAAEVMEEIVHEGEHIALAELIEEIAAFIAKHRS